MGDLIYLCEQCARARGTIEVVFPTGAVMRMCPRCDSEGWDIDLGDDD